MANHPFVVGVPLDARLDIGVEARGPLVSQVAREIAAGEYYLILAPAGSGRTSMLKALERELTRDARMDVLMVRPEDLPQTSEAAFFERLCELSDVAVGKTTLPPVASEGSTGISLFGDWIDDRLPALRRPLAYLFDDIDLIPPNIIQRLAGLAHGLHNQRIAQPALHRVRFVFAGGISLRYLTLMGDPGVSPFNLCKEAVLRDLDRPAALGYLRGIVQRFDLPFHDEAVQRVIDWVGGDLNLIQRVCALAIDANPARVLPEHIEAAIDGLVPERRGTADDSLRRTILLIEEDRRTLELVLELLRAEPQPYVSGSGADNLLAKFSLTYHELCGALTLVKKGGIEHEWRFRHRLARLLAERHFVPHRLVRVFAGYGDFQTALVYVEPLLARVRAAFAAKAFDFENTGFSDVLMALTHRIYAGAAYEAAYDAIARVLKGVFGCTEATYFDYQPPDKHLRALKFLNHIFEGNDGSSLSVEAAEHQDRGEVRAFRTGLFATHGGGPDGTQVSIPLRTREGAVTSVVRARVPNEAQSSLGLAIKVQLIQRALNPINIALNNVEATRKEHLIDSARLVSGDGRRVEGAGKLEVFVAHRFSEELLANLRDHLGRADAAFQFRYPDQQAAGGLLLVQLRHALERAGLALYEVSTPNNNVYFEMGLGLGINLPGLVFCRSYDGANVTVPPLLEGLLRLDYQDYAGLLNGLTDRLQRALSGYLQEGRDSQLLHFLGERAEACQRRTPYALVLDHNHFGDRRDYREALQAAMSPQIQVVFSDNLRVLRENLSLDGPPRSALLELYLAVRCADMVVFRAEDFSGDADASQAFLGAGIAHGLRHRSVHMTLLKQHPRTADPVRPPADLRGYPAIEYLRLADLRSGIGESLAGLPQ